ncbi:MAG TPA: glutamyl-tRNA reductase, partial [Acidimicrobiales bacterium]|nr:glutamyl-tRNA reductase [Acidimicrobiales bacterium]
VSVIVLGLNHRSVPLELLERVTVPSERLPKALHDLTSRENVSVAVVLSTCMRTEVYVVAERFHGAAQDVRNFLSELAFVPPEEFSDHLYTYVDEAAAAHLFAVAAGLDSLVPGESQILGQVRDAWERARAEGAAASRLSALFRRAVEVGKRARTETAIGRGITSVAHAAVAMAADRLGTLAGRRIVVLGAGEMGKGTASALAAAGAGGGELVVVNRTSERAKAVAQRVGGRGVPLEELPDVLAEADVLLSSTGAPGVVVEEADLARAIVARTERPLLVVDLGMPRNVDPAVGELPGVTLLDLDDLRAFADAGIDARRGEVARVRAVIAEELTRYTADLAAREVAPTVTALRAHADALREQELERHRHRLGALDPRQQEAVEALTRRIVAKLLHEPTVRLKDAAGSPRGERLAGALRELFDL